VWWWRVKGRTLLMVGVGVLLPLPLVLLSTLLLSRPGPENLTGPRIIPVLDNDRRASLMTYRRGCRSADQCDPPLGCVYDPVFRRGLCTDSRCTRDADCPQGVICREMPVEGSEMIARLCIPLGVRQEGENCHRLPEDRESACGEGLLCAGKDGWCARPCRLDAPGQCAEGFFCADTRPEPVCLPTCEKQGCPEGQHCIRFEEGTSTCEQVYGTNCQQTPCLGEQTCIARTKPKYPGKAWVSCLMWCSDEPPRCPEGMSCGEYFCALACDPEGPRVCPEGYRCERGKKDGAFGCQRDW